LTAVADDSFAPTFVPYDLQDLQADNLPTPALSGMQHLFDIASYDASLLTLPGPGSASGGSVSLEPSASPPSSAPTPLHPGLSRPAKRGADSPPEPDVALKRHRNNIAAKKYRQKRLDRISELEAEVDDIKQERDDLRIKLARQEAETAALREMLKMMKKSNDSG
jgi:uncharacterized protein (UPF0335 family)